MTPNTEIHSLLQDLAECGQYGTPGPILMARVIEILEALDVDSPIAVRSRIEALAKWAYKWAKIPLTELPPWDEATDSAKDEWLCSAKRFYSQNLGPVMVERIKRAKEECDEEPRDDGPPQSLFRLCESRPAFDWSNYRDGLDEDQAFAFLIDDFAALDSALDTAARVGDDARVPTMQERAAKVNDDAANAIEKISSGMGPDSARRGREVAEVLRTAAGSIRDLSPDPTRAALEECVRAMEVVIRKLKSEFGSVTILDQEQLELALATAKTALQGE